MELEADDLQPASRRKDERRPSSLSVMSEIFDEAASDLLEPDLPSHSQEMPADMQALFGSLESLAEAASQLILGGQVDQAVQLLEEAFAPVGQDGGPEIAMAGVGVQVLLCAGLSQAGRHQEAVDIAQRAVESADEVLAHLEDAKEADEQVPRKVLHRAIELAVQARQCQAVEMEFTGPEEVDFWRQLLALHEQCVRLAQHLPQGSCVRLRAEQAKREWQMRAAGATLPNLSPSSSSSQAWRTQLGVPPVSALRRSDAGAGLQKHERLHQGIPPPVDLEFERWRRRPSARSSTMPSLGSEPTLPEASSTWSDSTTLPGVKPWSKNLLPPGDLYVTTALPKSDLPRNAAWASTRRVPVLFSIQGTEGKASWALRTVRRRDRAAENEKKINAFEDWRKNGSGPKMRLTDQVLQTDKGIQYFQGSLKKQSYRFKNFWMKDMVTHEDLYEDRTFFCSEGLRVLKKNPRRQARPVSPTKPEAKKLFSHYGVSCPSLVDQTGLHAELSSYSELLAKSQHVAKMAMPFDRSHGRRLSLGQFDELRSILRKHRRTQTGGGGPAAFSRYAASLKR